MQSSSHIQYVSHFATFMVLLYVVIGATSCSTSRRIIREPLKAEGADFLFQKLKDNEVRFETFSAKFSATYTEKKKQTSVNGQLRIKRDSIIWISISPALGIEMMRIAITRDSMKLIDRIEAVSIARNFNYMNQWINRALDYDMVQAMITGNDFAFYEQGKFQADVDNQQYKLVTRDRHKLKKYIKGQEEEIVIPIQNIWLDPDNYKITRVMIRETVEDNRKFEAMYGDFKEIYGQLFPYKINYAIQAAETHIAVSLRFIRVTINEPLTFPFNVPENYSRQN